MAGGGRATTWALTHPSSQSHPISESSSRCSLGQIDVPGRNRFKAVSRPSPSPSLGALPTAGGSRAAHAARASRWHAHHLERPHPAPHLSSAQTQPTGALTHRQLSTRHRPNDHQTVPISPARLQYVPVPGSGFARILSHESRRRTIFSSLKSDTSISMLHVKPLPCRLDSEKSPLCLKQKCPPVMGVWV